LAMLFSLNVKCPTNARGGKGWAQWRSQPDNSVPLCKYWHVYKLSTQSISKEMNDELTFASGAKPSGWLRAIGWRRDGWAL
jgi:hypothetical protein